MTKLSEGKVIGVFRKCRTCGVWKPLAHYLLLDGEGRPIDSRPWCAACRIRRRHRPV